MTEADDICPEIDRSSWHLHGETFVFEVQSACMVPDRPDHAALEIAVFRRTVSGPAHTATVRVTSPLRELDRVPTLLTSALEEWLLRTTTALARVH